MISYQFVQCIVAILLINISTCSGEAFAQAPCVISIGALNASYDEASHYNATNKAKNEKNKKDKNTRKMKMVDLTDFSIDQCASADQVSIRIEGNTSTFNILMSEEILKPPTMINGNMDNDRSTQSLYLYGEDENSGSTINILQTSDRRVVASINNDMDGTITQIGYDADGNAVADVKSVSDFPPEADAQRPLTTKKTNVPHQNPSERLLMPSNDENQFRRTSRKNPDSRRTNAGDDGSQLDIMVLWTKKAECQLSGRPDGCSVSSITTSRMNDLIDLAIAETNTAYSLSGVDTALNLVHSYRSDSYVEEDSSDDPFRAALNAVTNRNDGLLVEVHSLREYYGADLVAMIIDDPLYCGVAWTGPDKDYMFSVTAWNCATGYYTFGHEIGKCKMIGTCIIVTRPHSNLHYPKINSLPLYKCISNSTNYRPGCF